MTLLKFTHVSVDCFRRLLKLDYFVHFIPDTYNFVLLRQDSQIQNYTPKNTAKIIKMCSFSLSIWKILNMTDLLLRRALPFNRRQISGLVLLQIYFTDTRLQNLNEHELAGGLLFPKSKLIILIKHRWPHKR